MTGRSTTFDNYSQIFPIADHVAIPIESAGEAGALKFADVEVEVLGRQPAGQLFRDREPVAHPAAVRNRGHSAAGSRCGRIARSAVVKAQQPPADVRLDLGFDAARLLKVLNVEFLRATHRAECLAWPARSSGGIGDAQNRPRAEH